MAARAVPELEQGYPEPGRFGDVPASGFYVRHVNNIEFTNVELAWSQPDMRPVFSLNSVNGVEFFRLKTPKAQIAPVFALHDVQDFSVMASRNLKDVRLDKADQKDISSSGSQ